MKYFLFELSLKHCKIVLDPNCIGAFHIITHFASWIRLGKPRIYWQDSLVFNMLREPISAGFN